MTDQRRKLHHIVSPHSSPGTTPAPTHDARAHGTCLGSGLALAWSTELHGTGECCRHAATINMLPGDIFLEIFAFYLRAYREDYSSQRMREWQRLAHVCQRWQQIIYASPCYLDLRLYCSDASGTPVKKVLSCWPAFPIAISYQIPDNEDDVLALLEHSNRVRLIDLTIRKPQWGNVVAAMQGLFPVLTDLHLFADHPGDADVVIPSGFLGGSAPCLQRLVLYYVPFPELPTLLLSAHDLVTLHYINIPPTGYISPEAMVAGLAVLTRLETLYIRFYPRISPPEQIRSPDSPMRAILPALTSFEFGGWGEYLEGLVAQIDAPRLDSVGTTLGRLDFLRVHQLFLFIGRTEKLRFRRARVDFCDGGVDVQLRVVQYRVSDPVLRLVFLFPPHSNGQITMLRTWPSCSVEFSLCAPTWNISPSIPVKTF